MKRKLSFILVAFMVLALLSGCGPTDDPGAGSTDDGKLKVITSFTIIEDMTREIAGDKVDIHNLVPNGTDPHEYEPLPQDVKKASDADIFFYNGLNLEGGEDGWFFRMIDSVGQSKENIYKLTERVEPMYISGDDGKEQEVNPHSFADPVVGIHMAEDIRDILMEVDSDNKDFYEEKANEYIDKLKAIDNEYREKIEEIAEENRILVTSESAYQYMAKRYGLKEGYIWAIDTEENGSPDQIKSLLGFIEENDVKVLFVESNVDTRPMETVS